MPKSKKERNYIKAKQNSSFKTWLSEIQFNAERNYRQNKEGSKRLEFKKTENDI